MARQQIFVLYCKVSEVLNNEQYDCSNLGLDSRQTYRPTYRFPHDNIARNIFLMDVYAGVPTSWNDQLSTVHRVGRKLPLSRD